LGTEKPTFSGEGAYLSTVRTKVKTTTKARSLNAKQQRLAVAYLPFARSVAQSWKDRFPFLWEEFDSAAFYGLVEAVRTYNARKGTKFTTWAYRRIVYAFMEVQRLEQPLGARRSTFELEPIASVEGFPRVIREKFRMVGRHEYEPSSEQKLDDREEFEGLLKGLSRRAARICRLIYVDGLTLDEVADELHLPPLQVYRIHSRSLDRLRAKHA
jgi:RNA polymerase sigma factor (sigma-70 family)